MINKVFSSFDEAISPIKDGDTLLIGGFGGPYECPSYLIAAVARTGVKNLTIVCNSPGRGLEGREAYRRKMAALMHVPEDYVDPATLVERGQVKRGIVSFAAAMEQIYTPFERAVMSGDVELMLTPQGTIAERVRAARAGIAAFYTPVGVGTFAAEGKEIREFDGRQFVLEKALKGDLSIIRADKADRYGNLVYRNTGRTFNATMAGASTITIAEVDELVELGALNPEHIVTPGLYVQRVVVRPRSPQPWDKPL
jgi:3-oxoacid CoA-transferase A subunit